MSQDVNLDQAMDSLEKTAMQVKRERDRFRNLLVDILEECDGREDVEDRPDNSGVRANIWMRLSLQIKDALRGTS